MLVTTMWLSIIMIASIKIFHIKRAHCVIKCEEKVKVLHIVQDLSCFLCLIVKTMVLQKLNPSLAIEVLALRE